jgi:hypothetical protein
MAEGGVNNDPRARRAARAAEASNAMERLAEQVAANRAEQHATGGDYSKGSDGLETNINLVVKGVTVNWLAQAFHMDHRTVTQRLKDCPPLTRKRGSGGLIYDLSVAAGYLVKPVFDVEAYIKTMKIEELPTKLQEGFWAAALKRQKWEENAGRLWRTEVVAKKFSETFLMVMNDMKMWVDDLEAVVGITDEQRDALHKAVSRLQKKIIKSVSEMPRVTQPQAAEMIQPVTVAPVTEEEPDDIDADILAVV